MYPSTRLEQQGKSTHGGIRRKRIVLSCLVCKQRKVKCDRQAPVCMRCTEAGYPGQCRYDDRPSGGEDDAPEVRSRSPVFLPNPVAEASANFPMRNDPVSDASNLGMLPGELLAPINDDERSASNQPGMFPVTPATTNQTTRIESEPGSAEATSGRPLIQGRGFNTQFHGMSHSVNMISYCDGLREFLKKTASDHPVLGAHRWAIETVSKNRQSSRPRIEEPGAMLRQLLPPERECRPYMLQYFRHFEGMFRIIHSPSFWRQYEDLWAGSKEMGSAFIALLLAAMSCARCLYVGNPISFEGDSSSARNEAIQWVHAVETWHDQQSQKHTTLDVFQIKCLLLLSKKLNSFKIKRHYMLSQTLLASAVSIGLHQNPSSLGARASFYDKEMRKRLWATISELNLTESVERGVPSLIAQLHSDIEPPGNFREDDFDESTTEEPAAQDEDVLTISSFARYAHTLRPLHHTINELVNQPEKHKGLCATELNSYHEQIFNKFVDLRSWPNRTSPTNLGDANIIGTAYLHLQLHKLLIMLHLPFAMGKSQTMTSSHSRFICRGSARSIINIYSQLSEQGFSKLCLTRNDLMRATLCLCQIESMGAENDPIYASASPSSETVQLIDQALHLVEERILALGNGFRGLWLLFAASCFVEPNKSSAASALWQEKVVNRVIVLCSKICLCQVSKGQDKENSDALFARYMKHIQHTSIYAKVDTGGTQQDNEGALRMTGPAMSDLTSQNPLIEGGTDDWLNSLDEIGFYNWMET